MSGPDLTAAAATAAGRGWSVFPCRPRDKRPAVPDHAERDCKRAGLCANGHRGWEQLACADPDRVARHWPGGANVGIACGPSRLVVVDLDAHGVLPQEWQLPGLVDGRDVFAQLADWAGQPWPSTFTVATPTGGWHCYFTAPTTPEVRNSAGLLGPQIDVRARGGYVVAAGSVLDDRAYPDKPELAALVKGGKPYAVVDNTDAIPLPPWLVRLLSSQERSAGSKAAARPVSAGGTRRLAGLCKTVAEAEVGQRNQTLYWAACRGAEAVAARQADVATITAALVSSAVEAGLPEGEARRTVDSALRGEV